MAVGASFSFGRLNQLVPKPCRPLPIRGDLKPEIVELFTDECFTEEDDALLDKLAGCDGDLVGQPDVDEHLEKWSSISEGMLIKAANEIGAKTGARHRGRGVLPKIKMQKQFALRVKEGRKEAIF